MSRLMTIAPDPKARPNPLFAETRMPRAAQLLRRRYRAILAMAILGLACAIGYLKVTPHRYTAQATLALGGADASLASGKSAMGAVPMDFATVRTQVQILESWTLAANAVAKLGVVAAPRDPRGPALPASLVWLSDLYDGLYDGLLEALGARPGVASPEIHRQLLSAVDEFRRGLAVVTDGRSFVIQIRYQSEDPKIAAAAANTVAELYLGDQLEYKTETIGRLSRWLSQRIQTARANLHDTEWALRLFRQQNNLVDTKGLTITQQQLAELNSQLVLATAELAQREARARNLKEIARTGSETAAAPEVLASPLIQVLRDQEAQLTRKAAEAASRYGEKHPAAQGSKSEIADLRHKIAGEIDKIALSVAAEADMARARAGSLRATIDNLQRAVSSASTADVRLRELEQQAQSERAELATFLAHAAETADQELLIRADARLVSAAVEPLRPSAPKTFIVLLLGLGGGLLVGAMIAVWRDRTDDGVRGVGQIEAIVGVPCLALLPKLRRIRLGASSAAMEVVDRPGSAFSEAVRSIVATLEFSSGAKQPKVILVTSTLPGAGKTFFAASLGRSAAKAGLKVLLIDCNLRRPAVAGLLRCADDAGLDALVSGRELIESPIQKDPASGLHILPTHASSRADETLASPALGALIDEARRHYDLVILDGPALMHGADAVILWRLVELGLVLVPWRRTRINALLRALHRVSVPSGKRLATVLSEVPTDRYARYLRGQVM